MMNKKGQGALEYLLLIGGAVLVAVIVITLLLQITAQGEADTTATADAAAETLCKARLNTLCADELDAGTTTTAEIILACDSVTGDTSETTCP